ncbi:acyltransferase [Pantoea agglomerans]|uniref:acyltransferase family protein n=1 Tax=Pantoea TaxID=53335 RepID=UPI0006817109|nr:acyltransferase [Pantoea vagans]KNH31633.1 acyltransferase [Pantoea vagans]
MKNNKHRIEALDGLRFIAFLMVMFYHYLFIAPLQGYIPRAYAVEAFSFGEYGVDLFFLISGFVITLSSENRTARAFLIARFNRIVPLFIACAFIVFFFSISLPMIDAKERIISLLYSLSFFPKLFGEEYFSAVYWTIAIEVTFYILVAILMSLKLWDKKRILICGFWLASSYLNCFILKNTIMSSLLITQYAGHFILGIMLFELRTSSIKPVHILIMLLSSVLVYNNMLKHQLWIDGFKVYFDHASILFTCFFLIVLVWIGSNISSLGVYYPAVKFLGAMTYPLYLIHADLGFWSHAIFERKWWSKYPLSQEYIGYYSMALISVVLVFSIAYILVKYLDPIVQRQLKKFWILIGAYKNVNIKN